MTKRAGDDVVCVPKARRFKLSKQSRAYARRVRVYNAWARAEVERRRRCEACPRVHQSGWVRGATLIHHRRFRGQGGAWVSLVNTLALCGPCHDWIHTSGNQAYCEAVGLIVRPDHDEWDACGVEELAA